MVGRGRWGAGLGPPRSQAWLSPHFELLAHQTARRSLPLSRPLASTLRNGLREVRPDVGPTPPGPPGPASGHRAGAPWLSTRGPGGGNGPDPPAQPGPPPAPAAGPHVWGMTSRCSQSGSSRSPGVPWPLWSGEWAPDARAGGVEANGSQPSRWRDPLVQFVPHVVTPTHKMIFMPLLNCNVAAMNRHVNI